MTNTSYIDIDWKTDTHIWKFENYIAHLIHNVVWFSYILSYMVSSATDYVTNYYMFSFPTALVSTNK